jgi:hypothetical protein
MSGNIGYTALFKSRPEEDEESVIEEYGDEVEDIEMGGNTTTSAIV